MRGTGEVVFAAQQTLDEAVGLYADLKGLVGQSESEAQEKFEQLQALIDPIVGLTLTSNLTGGFDLSAYPIDGPISDLPLLGNRCVNEPLRCMKRAKCPLRGGVPPMHTLQFGKNPAIGEGRMRRDR